MREPRKYNLDEFSGVHWAKEPSDWHRCGVCGFTRLTSCQGESFKEETVWLCEGCKEKMGKTKTKGLNMETTTYVKTRENVLIIDTK